MVSFVSSYMKERLEFMYREISNSTPGSRYWLPSNKPGRVFDYVVYKSTFPYYCKFFYEKPSKDYKFMTEDEKKSNYVFHGNTIELLRIIKKVITNKKKLTERQLLCVEILFNNFISYENDYYEENRCNLL